MRRAVFFARKYCNYNILQYKKQEIYVCWGAVQTAGNLLKFFNTQLCEFVKNVNIFLDFKGKAYYNSYKHWFGVKL